PYPSPRSAASTLENVQRWKRHPALAAAVDSADVVVVRRAAREAGRTEHRLDFRGLRFLRCRAFRRRPAMSAGFAEDSPGLGTAPYAHARFARSGRLQAVVALASAVEPRKRAFPAGRRTRRGPDLGRLDVEGRVVWRRQAFLGDGRRLE